jgi:DNA polymerase I
MGYPFEVGRRGLAEADAGKKILLIDAMSLVFRAFFAPMQAALVSASGVPTKATYIFLRTLRKLLKKYSPDYIAVAFDLAAPTFRDELFRAYKANRPAFPEDLTVQLPYVRRFCRALGIPLVEREGFEADDVIGTLAKQAAAEGLGVFIVSGDEDLFQLVDKNVLVLKPSRGAGEEETLCDEAKVEEILGVKPAQVVDWLALTGDSSDNIPGARPLPGQEPTRTPGAKKRSYIGPKGATELIRRFGTLEEVLDNYEKVEKQSYREALRDFRNEALLSKQLAIIRSDVPLETGLEQLKPAVPDFGEITALCQELGFSSLLKELLEEAPRATAAHAAAVEAEELGSGAALENWIQSLEARAPVAIGFSVEGEEGFGARLKAFGFSDGKRLATLPLATSRQLLEAAKPVITDATRPKAVHNSKLLRLLLGKERVELAGVADDTMLYSYLLEPLASSHALEDVVLRRLSRPVWASPAAAAECTRQLAGLLAPEVAHQGLRNLYDQIELPLSAVLADMEAVGMRIDPAILAVMSGEFERELADLTREIHGLAGQAFDIDSPKQLGEILFDKLKLPGGKKLRKSGQYSTGAGVLEDLAESPDLPNQNLPRKIIEYRTRAKLKSTYVDALPKFINPQTGRLHTSFNQTVARTGRLSSSNPNLQNIPIGDEFGLRIRSAFVAEPGWRLISADYSQIELRVLAHMSEDPALIDAFSRNEDIHSRTAQEVFGVPPALQTHEHRRVAKAINYGVVYGISSFGLAERTGTSKTEAQQYIDQYFLRHSCVKELLERIKEEARSSGRVRTLFGRFRPIPEIRSRDVTARNRAEREALNAPLQGTAADLMKLAMVKLHARLRYEKMRTRMILTVHDELVCEAPESEVEAAQVVVKTEMEGAYTLKVPLRVDIGVGKNWKEAK